MSKRHVVLAAPETQGAMMYGPYLRQVSMADPAFMEWALGQIAWPRREIARQIGLHYTTVNRWASGETKLPAEVRAWLFKLAIYHTEHMPPVLP